MKHFLRWTFILAMVIALVAVGAVACDDDETEEPTTPATGEPTAPATEEPDKEPYKIGAVLAVTGGASHLGEPEKNTAEMMEDQINEAGGINGHPIDVIIYDTETSADKAATMVTRLVEQDNVLAIIGPTTSGISNAIKAQVTTAEISLVSCAAALSIVTPIEESYWVFKTPQTEVEAIHEIYGYMQEQDITEIAIITVTDGFGSAGEAYLKSDAADFGITIVDSQTYAPKDASVQSQLTHIKGENPQAIVCWDTDKGSAVVALDMETLQMDIPLFCSHGIANKGFIEGAGDAANGVIFPAGKLLVIGSVADDDPQKEVLAKYKADYEAKYGEGTVNTFGGHLYDAISMVAIALENIDEGLSTTEARAQVRDQLEQITGFAGTGGVFTMTTQDHLGMAPGSLALIKIVDGEWTSLR